MTVDVKSFEEVIESARPEIEKALRAKLVEDVSSSMQWQVKDAITAEVKKFVEDEIAPEIAVYLAGEKGAILGAAQDAAAGIAVAITKGMQAQAEENLSKSWGAKKIMSALFD